MQTPIVPELPSTRESLVFRKVTLGLTIAFGLEIGGVVVAVGLDDAHLLGLGEVVGDDLVGELLVAARAAEAAEQAARSDAAGDR